MRPLRATDAKIALWKNYLISILQSFLYYLKILHPRNRVNQISPNIIWEDQTRKEVSKIPLDHDLWLFLQRRWVKALITEKKYLWTWITSIRRQFMFHTIAAAAAAAKSLQLCPTLCDPINGSPPGSPIPGILQARTLEWVATSFSSAWKWKVKVKSLSHVRLLATPWIVSHLALLSMGFSRQEYWREVPLPMEH